MAAGVSRTRCDPDQPVPAPRIGNRRGALPSRGRASDRAARTVFSLITGNIPRAFFVFLPLFALLLELFYRKQGYYVDHLVLSVCFHAFVFLTFSLFFLVEMSRSWLPEGRTFPVRLALLAWPFVYLPIAVRRVYGGSRRITALKCAGLAAMYLPLLFLGFLALTVLALAVFRPSRVDQPRSRAAARVRTQAD